MNREWISVKDRLPEWDEGDVWVWVNAPSAPYDDLAYYESGSWFERGGDRYLKNVTHWMSMPDPPA